MRRSLRFLVPLALALAAIAYAVVPLVDELTLRWFLRDLDIRARLVATAVEEPLVELLTDRTRDRIRLQRVHAFLTRVIKDERLFALGYCDAAGALLYRTELLPSEVRCPDAPAAAGVAGRLLTHARGSLHVATAPIVLDGAHIGSLLIVHDMNFIERRSADTKRYVVYLFAGIGAVVALITVVIAEVSWRGWMAGTTALIRGQVLTGQAPSPAPELRPIARDLAALVQDLASDRRARDEAQVRWDPEALRRILREDLAGDEVLAVSNREPYIHVRRGGQIEVQRPASGLVTALEPIMRACAGTWIAHGSGGADRETVDATDSLRVPPDAPEYRPRRVLLSEAEEAGYYYGLANEGLWPPCHIAHTRPTFRTPDWRHYETVNRRFADVVEQEARTASPLVLVQDYHFALLPRLIRERLPEATIVTFWHIPWPNPEAFGICPWREQILERLLGSSILGFCAVGSWGGWCLSMGDYVTGLGATDGATAARCRRVLMLPTLSDRGLEQRAGAVHRGAPDSPPRSPRLTAPVTGSHVRQGRLLGSRRSSGERGRRAGPRAREPGMGEDPLDDDGFIDRGNQSHPHLPRRQGGPTSVIADPRFQLQADEVIQ